MPKHLLPPKSTRLERALTECCADIERVEIPIRDIHNPNKCPHDLLPYLAWARSVDRWDDNWSEEAKRQVIRQSFKVHKRKGTISAIRTIVEPMGYLLGITEWWQAPDRLPRGSFELEVGVSDLGITEATFEEIERLIDDAKPLSRHLLKLGIQIQVQGSQKIYAGAYDGDVMTIYPKTYDAIEVSTTKTKNGMATHIIDMMEIF